MERVMTWLPNEVMSCIPENEIIENAGLREQVTNVASLDCLVAPFALMPDAHSGFGMPIGGVAALKNAISPNMVGVDIGCGMLSCRTYMEKEELFTYRDTFAAKILDRIPVGVGGERSRSGSYKWNPKSDFEGLDVSFAATQLGTLGSGNHFIELGYDDDDNAVWVTIHSGSRRLGQVIAKHYHNLAVEFCRAEGVQLPHSDLAYLVKGTPAFDNYVRDMWEAVIFAQDNRQYMMDNVLDILKVDPRATVSSTHNFGKDIGNDIILHRKGATPATSNNFVVIPMNMGDGIIIGKGKGAGISWGSCSHGAGRVMGRNEAKKTLDINEQEAYMEARDVKVYTKKGSSVLDEMPGAYKDWEQVMSRQSDLVDIEIHIKSCATIKG